MSTSTYGATHAPHLTIDIKPTPCQNWLMNNEPVGKRIERLRLSMGFSRDKLGQAMGISPTAIYKVESGRTKWPTTDLLQRYASHLTPAMPRGVDPIAYLVYGIEPSAPPVEPRTDWAIDNDEELNDDARAYLRHALEYVRRTQTRKDSQNAS